MTLSNVQFNFDLVSLIIWIWMCIVYTLNGTSENNVPIIKNRKVLNFEG